MRRSSSLSSTDIELPESVTTAQLADIIAGADLPDHTRVCLPKSHEGVELLDNPKALPTQRRANAFINTKQVTTAEKAPFGAWPTLIRALERHRQSGGKVVFDADVTRSMGAFVWGDELDLKPVHAPLKMDVSTADGILTVHYYGNGDVFLTVDFSPEATCSVCSNSRITNAQPVLSAQTGLNDFSEEATAETCPNSPHESQRPDSVAVTLRAEKVSEEAIRRLKDAFLF